MNPLAAWESFHVAYDEWNLRSWHHPKFPRMTVQNYEDPEVKRLVQERENNEIASQYTMADALFTASFFNACLRHVEDVGIANMAPLVNTRGPHSLTILKVAPEPERERRTQARALK